LFDEILDPCVIRFRSGKTMIGAAKPLKDLTVVYFVMGGKQFIIPLAAIEYIEITDEAGTISG